MPWYTDFQSEDHDLADLKSPLGKTKIINKEVIHSETK